MKVSIIESDSGRVVASYVINLGDADHELSDEEYYSHAWQCAVEDGSVDEEDPSEYSFSLTPVTIYKPEL